MRGAPQVGFSTTMRRINSRNSLLTHFLPTGARCRESHLQYNLKPARGQRTTVSGWMRSSGAKPKIHPAKKLKRRLDILTVKTRLDPPTRASWKAMKTQADGI